MFTRRWVILSFVTLLTLICFCPFLIIENYISEAKDYKTVLTAAPAGTKTTSGSVLTQQTKENQSPTTSSNEEGINDENKKMLVKNIDGKKANSITILFLGTDRTEERDKTLGIFRTDTIALAVINLDTKKVDILNIPRDTYAYIPLIKKKDKINHAYAFGSAKGIGIKSSIEAVNNFIKYTNIDYYFALDMEPIPKIVDDLNGVEMDVEVDMKTHGANLTKGFQLLDGKKAFDYIHWRYSAGGDIDRIKRQQKFFKAMYTKLRDKDQLINAAKLAVTYEKYIKTNMSTKQLISLAMLAKDIPGGSTAFHTIPGYPKNVNNLSYWYPDEEKTEALLKQLFQ